MESFLTVARRRHSRCWGSHTVSVFTSRKCLTAITDPMAAHCRFAIAAKRRAARSRDWIRVADRAQARLGRTTSRKLALCDNDNSASGRHIRQTASCRHDVGRLDHITWSFHFSSAPAATCRDLGTFPPTSCCTFVRRRCELHVIAFTTTRMPSVCTTLTTVSGAMNSPSVTTSTT